MATIEPAARDANGGYGFLERGREQPASPRQGSVVGVQRELVPVRLRGCRGISVCLELLPSAREDEG